MNRVEQSIATLNELLEPHGINVHGTLGREGGGEQRLVWVLSIRGPDGGLQAVHAPLPDESAHDLYALEKVARRIRVHMLDGDVEAFQYTVRWSREDAEYVGTCPNFSSLSWLSPTDVGALAGIKKLVREVVKDQIQEATRNRPPP